MLTTETLREKASLLRKNAKFIEELAEARSCELYGQFYSNDHVHTLGYYTLVGVNGNLEGVIPLPVLVLLMEDQSISNAQAWDLVMEYLCSKPIRMDWKENRTCALGTHMRSQDYFVHGTLCDHEWRYDQDENTQEVEDCLEASHCQTCGEIWLTEEEPPKVPLGDYLPGFAQEFIREGVEDRKYLCRKLTVSAASAV